MDVSEAKRKWRWYLLATWIFVGLWAAWTGFNVYEGYTVGQIPGQLAEEGGAFLFLGPFIVLIPLAGWDVRRQAKGLPARRHRSEPTGRST
jgi:hypothetical protein